MNKRFIVLLTTFVFSVIFSISSFAYDVEVDGIYYNLISKGNVAEVTNGNKEYSGEITIPSSIKVNETEYIVTNIGNESFRFCQKLISVIIPNSVTNIGENSFSDCNNLKSVIIPNSVTNIENYAFWQCNGLTSITIPNSVTNIGNGVFSGCNNLTSITIPNSVTSIGDMTFSGCSSLTSITIPNSVTYIGFETFKGCISLTSITIPNSVTSIINSAFSGCGLTSITIPNSVTSIGDNVFSNCKNLTSVIIPNSVTSIGYNAFAKCTNLENIYCYVERFSKIYDDIFKDSYIEYINLYVPSSSLSYYQTTEPWSGFGTIKTLEDIGGEINKCETPTISFVDGKLTFSCETEDVEYVSEVTCSDINKYYSDEINFAACYNITVTAMKTGYYNSDVATAKIYWITSTGSIEDTNINNVSMRGIVIQSNGGFINISGLNNNENVSFYGIDGKSLGSTIAINGTTSFAAQSGSIVIVKIGKESIKIAVK